ncbi:MAG: response regulator, partial [Bacteroidales bacterium]|nr:response regulator [Bacteroidales bacterium]
SQISYANLLPGKYHLMLRAAKSDDNKATPIRQLHINVLPPWWKTSWAYLSYTLLISTISGLWFVWYRKRKNKQLAENQKLFEIEKEKELYQNKVTFFTEIAHEIRTPLTLIRGPLEIIQEMDIKDGKLAKNLSVIEQNTKRLLNLVSQLLDFQKIGADKLSPNYEIVNVTDLLKETVARFEPTFIHNGKSLIVEKAEENIIARIDREAITKIMSNIFNNALKYARKQAIISLNLEKDNFVLTVFSDNERIPDSQAEQIFEAFYQIDKNRQGVGIGLTMARSLALIHKGSLYLDPNRKDGNAFVLSIPLNMSDVAASPISTQQEDWTLSEHLPSSDTARSAHTVLIVEDDKDILSFMQERLSESFITECAANGQEALNILRQGNTDIVVSDVMMPLMNGFELCEAIKKDIDLCHIPVIFLTAKNDIDSKVHGLQVGAEAYIEKPFSFEYLKNQIISLLSNREKEREAFSKRPFFPVKNMQMSKEDEEFMNKVIQTINDNIADESFNVERMAETLCMSRSSLLRKIKPLFNMPPLDFIRLIRLKKAAELIQEGKYTVGEISYMVGFSSHSYFSKLFCRQFGIMPKDFERQVNEERQKSREYRGGIDIEEMMKKK